MSHKLVLTFFIGTTFIMTQPMHQQGPQELEKLLLEMPENERANAAQKLLLDMTKQEKLNSSMIQLFLKYGAGIDGCNSSSTYHTPPQTPLQCAGGKGNPTIIQLLIDAGASVNAVNQMCLTALHSAAASGNTEAVQVLLRAGANVRAVNDFGKRPWQYAKTQEILRLLKPDYL